MEGKRCDFIAEGTKQKNQTRYAIAAMSHRLARAGARAFSGKSVEGLPAPLYMKGPNGKLVSAWHDIPLRPAVADKGIFNFVCEIPKGKVPPKLEIDTEKPNNPIVQDKVRRRRAGGWP
jgi:hypothetical protein